MRGVTTFGKLSITIAVGLLAMAAPAGAAKPQTKIVRGSATTIEEHPWQVLVLIEAPDGEGYFQCGGSIIDATTVVTAAHCITDENTETVVNPTYVTVGYGATKVSQQLTSAVTEVTAPKAYPGDASFDVARLTLAAPLQGYNIDPRVHNVDIAPETSLSNAITNGDDGFVSGWGTTSEGGSTTPDTLRDATVPLDDDADCSRYAPDYVDARNVCAGGDLVPSDTCQGDSGGPLTLADDTLVGITAYGDGCGRSGVPGAYTQATNPDIKSVILGAPTVPVALGSQQPLYGQGSTPVVLPQLPSAPAQSPAVLPRPVATRDTTRPTLRYSKTTCKRGRCTVRLLASDNSGTVAKLSANVRRTVKKCKRVKGKRRCKKVTKKTTMSVKRVTGGFDVSAKLKKGTYKLAAVGTDVTGNRSLTLKRTLKIKG